MSKLREFTISLVRPLGFKGEKITIHPQWVLTADELLSDLKSATMWGETTIIIVVYDRTAQFFRVY